MMLMCEGILIPLAWVNEVYLKKIKRVPVLNAVNLGNGQGGNRGGAGKVRLQTLLSIPRPLLSHVQYHGNYRACLRSKGHTKLRVNLEKVRARVRVHGTRSSVGVICTCTCACTGAGSGLRVARTRAHARAGRRL